jgi:putative NADH-flavin reductase
MSSDMKDTEWVIDELEQVDAIISAGGVTAMDKLAVLNKYLKTRLTQLKQQQTRGDEG